MNAESSSNSKYMYQKPKSGKGKYDENYVARFNAVFGAPTAELVEVRAQKIQRSVSLIAQSEQRLRSVNSTQLADQVAEELRKLVVSIEAANRETDLTKRRDRLNDIKKHARGWADKAQFQATAKLASSECYACNALLEEAIKGLPDTKSDDSKALFKKVNQLRKEFNKVREKKENTVEGLKKKAEAFQEIRSGFRLEVAIVQQKAAELKDAKINLNDLENEAWRELEQAGQIVKGVPRENPRLAERVKTCRGLIQGGSNDIQKDRRSTAIQLLTSGIAEAKRISQLAAQLQEGSSLNEKVQAIKTQALNSAKENPDGPEASMITAMSHWGAHWKPEEKQAEGEKQFSQMLESAYELALLAKADISELSPGEVVAIYNYTTLDYKAMNDFCRDGVKDEEMQKFLTNKVETAKQALLKMSGNKKYQGMSMRGEKLWPGNAHEQVYVVGNTYKIPQFWSTGIKMSFSGIPLQLTIFGKSGMQVQMMSEKPHETEVLFAPGTSFKVTAKQETGKKDNKQYAIILEEV